VVSAQGGLTDARRGRPRVSLTPLRLADGPDFVAAARASRALHGRWVAPPLSLEAFRDKWQRMQAPVHHAYTLRSGDTGALVGYAEITNIVRGVFLSGYLGYYGFAGHERQGLMGEGVRLVAREAFQRLRLHRLEANVQPDNEPSIRLLQRCGFAKEGYSPRYLKIRGRWRDHERWALLVR